MVVSWVRFADSLTRYSGVYFIVATFLLLSDASRAPRLRSGEAATIPRAVPVGRC